MFDRKISHIQYTTNSSPDSFIRVPSNNDVEGRDISSTRQRTRSKATLESQGEPRDDGNLGRLELARCELSAHLRSLTTGYISRFGTRGRSGVRRNEGREIKSSMATKTVKQPFQTCTSATDPGFRIPMLESRLVYVYR